MTINIQKCQSHESQGKSEKLSQIRRNQGDLKPIAMQTKWIGHWGKDDTSGKTGEMKISLWFR